MRKINEGGEIVAVRTNRAQQVRDFIESGEQEREVAVHEGEYFGSVRAALCNSIQARPYFSARCFVQQRRRLIFLVRRDSV